MFDIFAKIPVSVLLLLSSASVIAGDFFAKYWSVNTRWPFYIFALLGYLGSGFFYVPTLLREGLVTTSLAWSLLSTIGFIVVGVIIFKEYLSLLQVFAITLGIISLMLLEIG